LSNIGAAKPSLAWHAKAEFLFEGDTPVRDEVLAGIRATVPGWVTNSISFPPETLRLKNRPPGNFTLIVRGAPREFFDSAPVTISRREVRRGKASASPEYRVDKTDALEEFRPVEGGNQAHTSDHVAHGHVHRCLPLMLGPDSFISRCALGC
jgi:hypothetical protein